LKWILLLYTTSIVRQRAKERESGYPTGSVALHSRSSPETTSLFRRELEGIVPLVSLVRDAVRRLPRPLYTCLLLFFLGMAGHDGYVLVMCVLFRVIMFVSSTVAACAGWNSNRRSSFQMWPYARQNVPPSTRRACVARCFTAQRQGREEELSHSDRTSCAVCNMVNPAAVSAAVAVANLAIGQSVNTETDSSMLKKMEDFSKNNAVRGVSCHEKLIADSPMVHFISLSQPQRLKSQILS
jgi:hypothetical protein